MKKIRKMIFETNSSSTHSLVHVGTRSVENYMSEGKHIKINFIDTDDVSRLSTLEDKVSYLVSHIVDKYKYNSANYDDLIEQVRDDWDFKRLESYTIEKFSKDIVFPENYQYDLDEIVSINHQLRNSDFDDLLHDIVSEERDLLDDILSIDKVIEIGRD